MSKERSQCENLTIRGALCRRRDPHCEDLAIKGALCRRKSSRARRFLLEEAHDCVVLGLRGRYWGFMPCVEGAVLIVKT